MSGKTRALLTASFAIIAIGLSATIFLLPYRRPSPALPNPNGYDDFIKAGELITGDVGNYQRMDLVSLKNLISSNTESLRLVRLGLTRRCSVPTELAIKNFGGEIAHISKTKTIAQLLRAESRLAELENHPQEAAKDCVEGLRFGNETSRGGFIIHRLVGIACEAIAGVPLAKLVDKLSCEEAQTLLPELERLDSERVSFEETRRIEKRFAYHELLKVGNPVQIISGWWEGRAVVERSENRHNTIVAHERLILIELALRCYQADHGNAATNLDQLTPKYIGRVPMDPFNQQPFHYKLEAGQWLVYSIGPDRVDDGGRPMVKGIIAKGDITYDSSW